MRYNVNCPHCGEPRSIPDYGLWPDDAQYGEPGEPQECLDCHGWMLVIVDDDAAIDVVAYKCRRPTMALDTARIVRNQLDVHSQTVDCWQRDEPTGEKLFLEGQFTADQLEAIAVLMRAGEI